MRFRVMCVPNRYLRPETHNSRALQDTLDLVPKGRRARAAKRALNPPIKRNGRQRGCHIIVYVDWVGGNETRCRKIP